MFSRASYLWLSLFNSPLVWKGIYWLIQLKSLFLRTYWILLFEFGSSVVATCSRKQTHSEEQCRWWSAVYYTSGPKAEFPLSQGPQQTFVKTLYTLSVLLKPTSPDSLNLAWKVLKGDTIRLQPWFIIRRVRWLYIVAYTNGSIRITKVIDYIGDYYILLAMGNLGIEPGVYQSGRPVRP